MNTSKKNLLMFVGFLMSGFVTEVEAERPASTCMRLQEGIKRLEKRFQQQAHDYQQQLQRLGREYQKERLEQRECMPLQEEIKRLEKRLQQQAQDCQQQLQWLGREYQKERQEQQDLWAAERRRES